MKLIMNKIICFAFALFIFSTYPVTVEATDNQVTYEYVYNCVPKKTIYRPGDTVGRDFTLNFIEYYEYVDENGNVTSNETVTDVTDKMTGSYDDTVVMIPGEYVNRLTGECGYNCYTFYVYDYGDVNGDYSITISDCVELHKIVGEDDSANQSYIFNADVDCDGLLTIRDCRQLENNLR